MLEQRRGGGAYGTESLAAASDAEHDGQRPEARQVEERQVAGSSQRRRVVVKHRAWCFVGW